MKVHLFSTDVSGLSLLDLLPKEDQITCIIVPSNRSHTEKVKTLMRKSDIPVYEHVRGKNLDVSIPPADVAISWMYSQIILPDDINNYASGIINMHGGKIPEYRGANVLHWAIINGEKELGVTWHKVVEEVDAGPVLSESKVPIPADVDALYVRAAMLKEALNIFPVAWDNILSSTNELRIPDLTKGRIWPSRKPEDGILNEGLSEIQVRDLLRALCSPWPAAQLKYNGKLHSVRNVLERKVKNSIPYVTAEGNRIYLQ